MEKQIGNILFIIFLLICRWYAYIQCSQQPAEARPSDLHPLPDTRAGERVSHKSLYHKATKNWNVPPTLHYWATDESLVSESKNEAQKGNSGYQGDEWARKTDSIGKWGWPWPFDTPGQRSWRPLIYLVQYYCHHSFCQVGQFQFLPNGIKPILKNYL